MDNKMKKNKAMRAAGGLFVAAMLSTSIISGTYAKYVTKDDASDSARVAAFGVKVEADGELFATTYYAVGQPAGNQPGASSATDTQLTVKSQSKYQQGTALDNVVAPGTKSNNEGLTFSITGTPEVDVKVDITFNEDTLADIFLGAGTYPNMTDGDVFDNVYDAANDVFTTTAAYYPIKYTLKHSATDISDWTSADVVTGCNGVSLNELVDAIDDYFEGEGDKVYKAGTDLATKFGYFNLTWEWDFDASGAGTYDKQDTLLGDLAHDAFDTENDEKLVTAAITAVNAASEATTLTAPERATNTAEAANGKYSLDVNVDFSISVTQVD